jgi:hypothetical protein
VAIPTFVNFGVAATGTTAVSPALPASLLVDDILLLFIETANEAITIPTPNGGTWTEVTGSPQGTGTAAGLASTRLTVFWSRYNGTQGAPTTSDSGDHQIAQITAWRGCIASGNPWDVTAGDVASAASTAVSIPGATTTVNDCLIVAIVSNATDTGTSQTGTWANASLSGVVERSDTSSTTGNGGGVGCASGGKAIAGAYSATTAVLATSSVQGRLSIALKPASSNAVALPGTGAPVFAGLAPLALLTIRIATGLGAPVFTGLAPTVVATNNIVIPTGVGAPVFTGQSPAVAIGAATVIQPGTGQAVFTGLGPTLLVTVNIPVGLGQPIFTGLAPTVAVSNNKFPAPGLGQPVFTGFAPSVVAAVTAKPGTGAVTFAGLAPSAVLSNNQIATTGLGQVTFAGFAPSISTATTASRPGFGQLVFTGFSPNVIQPIRPAIARSSAVTPIRTASSQTTGIRRRAGYSVTNTYTTSNTTIRTSDLYPTTSKGPAGG